MIRANVLPLVASLAVVFAVAAAGAVTTMKSIPAWYQALVKPSFSPPAWLFGPAWTVLYILMAVAAWLVWREGWSRPAVQAALIAYLVQLVLNALWSQLFFGLRSPLAGLVDILALWVMIVATLVLFYRVSTVAGLLLVPYLAWVSFATVLNGAILRLNPGP